MSLRMRMVSVALCAFALWPIVHSFLIPALDISPWKHGGMGMYATVHSAPWISVELEDEGTWREISYAPDERTSLYRAVQQDKLIEPFWGRLYKFPHIQAWVENEVPSAERLRVTTRRRFIEHGTSLVKDKSRTKVIEVPATASNHPSASEHR
jgi:hypothetical protein